MKRNVFILFFTAIIYCSNAQSYVSNVIGRYLCTRKVLDSSGNPSQPNCVCHLQLWQNNFYSNCVEYADSCYGGGVWSYISMDVEVLSDSTFQGFMPSTPANAASGKLYANDSIFYRIFFPIAPSYNRWKEFNGFKLYSFVGIEDLNKPENELLLSPQPASDVMYLQSTQLKFKQEDVPIVYDVSGKQIKLPMQYINTNTYKLDVSELSVGMYVVSIKTEKGVVRKKMIIEK